MADDRARLTNEYIYAHLNEIEDETPDQSLSAFRIGMVIAFAFDEVDDVRQMIFTDHLKIDKSVLQNAFDYFTGTGICKFETSSPESEFFRQGKKDREAAAELYTATRERVENFRQAS